MRNIETSTVINAPASEVWKTLMDFKSYPNWNPFIKTLKGNAVVGGQLTAELCLPGKKPMIFKPTVLRATPNKEFRWIGKLWVKGLFDGEHYFVLEKLDEQRTLFTHGENFSGLLSGLLFKMIEEETKRGFEEMNEALSERVEKRVL